MSQPTINPEWIRRNATSRYKAISRIVERGRADGKPMTFATRVAAELKREAALPGWAVPK